MGCQKWITALASLLGFPKLKGPKVPASIRRMHVIRQKCCIWRKFCKARQIKSGGDTVAANMLRDLQSVVLSETWWWKQIGSWVRSKPPAWETFICGWWMVEEACPRGGRCIGPDYFFTPSFKFILHFHIQIWAALQVNVDVCSPHMWEKESSLFWCLIRIVKSSVDFPWKSRSRFTFCFFFLNFSKLVADKKKRRSLCAPHLFHWTDKGQELFTEL